MPITSQASHSPIMLLMHEINYWEQPWQPFGHFSYLYSIVASLLQGLENPFTVIYGCLEHPDRNTQAGLHFSVRSTRANERDHMDGAYRHG